MSRFMQTVVLFFLAIVMTYLPPPEKMFGSLLFVAIALDTLVTAKRRQEEEEMS